MVNFMCQLDWSVGGPDIWPKVILCLSEEYIWMRLTFESVD